MGWLNWGLAKVGTGREGGTLLRDGSHGRFVFAGIGVGVGGWGLAKIAAYQGRFVLFWSCLTTCSEDGKITGKRRREDNSSCLGWHAPSK